MEPFPERTLAISPLDRRRGTQDNYEQDENPYDIKIATNGILSALTHGLVSKDRVNEVARFFKDTESNTPERMFENANLLMLHDAISFLDSYRADVRNRINMGYAIDPIAEVANFNNIFSHKLELYNSFLNTLSENFKNVNNEAVQNYRNSLIDVLNFVNNGGAINYILSDEQSQNYAQSANVLSNIRDNASSIHNNIMQRQTQSQPQQGPSQGSDSADKKPSPKQINEEGSLDFSSKIDLSLIKNAMDLHVAYGAFGVAMACAPIFAPVYTVALLWFIINYNLKPCEVKSENKIKFATKKIIEDFLKKNDINLPPPPLKNVLPPTLDGPNAHQRNNIPLQKQTDSNFGLPRGNIPMFVGPVIPVNRPPISVTHTVDDFLLDIDLGGVKLPKAATHSVSFSGIPIIIPRPKPSKSPTPPKPSKSTTPPESSSTPESSKSPTPPKPSTTPKASKSPTPPKPSSTPKPSTTPKPSKSTTPPKPSTTPKPSKSTIPPKSSAPEKNSKKPVFVQVYDFEKDLSLTKEDLRKYKLVDIFGIEQGSITTKMGTTKTTGQRGSQDMFERFRGSTKGLGTSSLADFNELVRFIEYCYRYRDKDGSSIKYQAITTANKLIKLKQEKINELIENPSLPQNIKIKLKAMNQMLDNVKANRKAGKYENDESFSVTQQTDINNKLHTRVLVDESDNSNRVGLRKTGKGEFEPLDGIVTLFEEKKSSGCYKVEQNEDGTYTISKRVEGPEEKYEVCTDLDEKTREAIVCVAQKNLEKLKQTEKEHKEDVPTPPTKPEDRTPKPKGHPTKTDAPKTSRGRVDGHSRPIPKAPLSKTKNTILVGLGGVGGKGGGIDPRNIPASPRSKSQILGKG